ncbi:hypothetical protein Sste5346_008573 [Sporothrix stenoceras]|uniref:Ankyrin repeat protein n=1 Tax=Sporothrix stenoceras TaxID=5173 RepID=A0ABR3YPY5_9PEZI
MTYEANGKYDRSVPLNPVDFPVLSEEQYEWDFVRGYKQEAEAIHTAIDDDNLPAIHELLRLLGPDMLYWCVMGEMPENITAPTLHWAVEMDHVAILTILLDYRDALAKEERLRVESAYEREEREDLERANHEDPDVRWPSSRPWGTVLTTACMCARANVVQLLLARMPEVDVNASDKFGYTPLQAVARHAQGVERFTEAGESERRIAIVKMLLAGGARVDTKLNDKPNALLLALMPDGGRGDAELVRFLIDNVGIDIHEGFVGTTARLDGRGINGASDDEDIDYIYDTIDDDDYNYNFDYANIPPMEADVYLTPLATAALYGNAVGVEALLQTAGADFTDDLTASIPPLHAAMVGRPLVRALDVREPRYMRRDINNVRVNARERAAAIKETGTLDITAPQFANRDLAAIAAAGEAADAAARAAYVDARVATVELLTADPAVCAKTINAKYGTPPGYKYTPLHLGARFDRLPLLRVLLDRGADPRIPMPPSTRTGKTQAMFTAVFTSIHRLCGWSSRAVEFGCTYRILVRAIDARVGEDMTALLRDLVGDDDINEAVNEVDDDGNTALHWTMGYCLPNATKALLALGARADAQNHAGEVPVEGTVPTTTRQTKHEREYI